MILADTSAWIAHLRDRPEAVAAAVAALHGTGELAVTEPVVMEVLAGARNRVHERALRRQLATATLIGIGGLDSWEAAASIYRGCRRQGVTLRSQLDCLVAAVAIRNELSVLHDDRDFDLIARHTPLRVAAV